MFNGELWGWFDMLEFSFFPLSSLHCKNFSNFVCFRTMEFIRICEWKYVLDVMEKSVRDKKFIPVL